MGATAAIVLAGGTLQAALTGVWLFARNRRLIRHADDLYGLSAIVQFFMAGGLSGQGSLWALVPGMAAIGFAWAATTEPGRRTRQAHLAALHYRDRNHP